MALFTKRVATKLFSSSINIEPWATFIFLILSKNNPFSILANKDLVVLFNFFVHKELRNLKMIYGVIDLNRAIPKVNSVMSKSIGPRLNR